VESAKPVTIGRANLDGTGVNRRFITGVTNGCGIAVVGGHIYWTNSGFADSRHVRNAIGRANLDGTGVNQRFIRTVGGPCGLAVYHGHIYWGQSRGASHTRARRRSDAPTSTALPSTTSSSSASTTRHASASPSASPPLLGPRPNREAGRSWLAFGSPGDTCRGGAFRGRDRGRARSGRPT
jgi:hypothetical protein